MDIPGDIPGDIPRDIPRGSPGGILSGRRAIWAFTGKCVKSPNIRLYELEFLENRQRERRTIEGIDVHPWNPVFQ